MSEIPLVSAEPTPSVLRLDFLPIALAFLRKLRVAELIDAAIPTPAPGPQSAIAMALGLPPPKPPPSVGTCAEAMILNILEGRVALCQMEQWLRGLAVDALWGPEVLPSQFTDDRLALALDDLFEAGTETLYSQIVAVLIRVFHIETDRLHFDTTSLMTYGAHDVPADLPGPRAVRGYSKDHRPDLLQWVFGMTVQRDGLPMVSTLQDGNTSDPLVHRSHLELLRGRMVDPYATTFVSDSKGCNAEGLGLLRSVKFHATTLMPHTFALHSDLIGRALEEAAVWIELARRPGETKDDPERIWRGCVLPCEMPLERPCAKDQDVGEAYTETFHAIVVRSSELQRTHEEAAKRRRERAQRQLRGPIKQVSAETFACAEDALAEAKRFVRKHPVPGLSLQIAVQAEEVLVRRGRGRPRADAERETTTVHRIGITIAQDLPTQQAERDRDGLFVLVTSRPIEDSYPASKVLADYQGQGVVETGFRWLKGPGQVAPMLLHTPARIEALSFLFTLTLLLYRLLQREVRRVLVGTEETVPGPNRIPTQRPTTAALMRCFSEVYLVTFATHAGSQTWLSGWLPLHDKILQWLDLPPDLYRNLAKIQEPR